MIFLIIGCTNNLIPGVYKTNFNSYGRFSKTLTLDCDGTATLNFQGDMMNDNSYGNWRTENDTVLIAFDTVNYPNSRFRKDLIFISKKGKLYRIQFSKKQYDELLNLAADSVKIPSYRKLARRLDKTPTNFQGNSKVQFFRRNESIKCKE